MLVSLKLNHNLIVSTIKQFIFYFQHILETYGYAFFFSLTGYIGVQIVLQLVRTGGAFAAVTVTTCRKAISIILSFMIFSKPFTFHYVYSGMLVVAGIYLNLYSKQNPNFSMVEWLRSNMAKHQGTTYKRFVQEV